MSTALFLAERHKITLTHMELIEYFSWDDDLTPLSDAPHAFPR